MVAGVLCGIVANFPTVRDDEEFVARYIGLAMELSSSSMVTDVRTVGILLIGFATTGFDSGIYGRPTDGRPPPAIESSKLRQALLDHPSTLSRVKGFVQHAFGPFGEIEDVALRDEAIVMAGKLLVLMLDDPLEVFDIFFDTERKALANGATNEYSILHGLLYAVKDLNGDTTVAARRKVEAEKRLNTMKGTLELTSVWDGREKAEEEKSDNESEGDCRDC
jgi:hypothetical protein